MGDSMQIGDLVLIRIGAVWKEDPCVIVEQIIENKPLNMEMEDVYVVVNLKTQKRIDRPSFMIKPYTTENIEANKEINKKMNYFT
jgi:hypothetical protein